MELPYGLVNKQDITTFQLARTFKLNTILNCLIFNLYTVTDAHHQPANSSFLWCFLFVFNIDLFELTEAIRLVEVKNKFLVSWSLMRASHNGLHLYRQVGFHNFRSFRSRNLNTIAGCTLHKVFDYVWLCLSTFKFLSCRREWTCELEFMRLFDTKFSYFLKNWLLLGQTHGAFQVENTIIYLGNFDWTDVLRHLTIEQSL